MSHFTTLYTVLSQTVQTQQNRLVAGRLAPPAGQTEKGHSIFQQAANEGPLNTK